MHVHATQVNPNAQLDALYAAQRAAANREAERTRKKLFESASEVAGDAESEACVVQFREREGDRRHSDPENEANRREPQRQQKSEDDSDASISDWV
jgi:hypothetical protein